MAPRGKMLESVTVHSEAWCVCGSVCDGTNAAAAHGGVCEASVRITATAPHRCQREGLDSGTHCQANFCAATSRLWVVGNAVDEITAQPIVLPP